MVELHVLGSVQLLRDGREAWGLIAQPKRLALLVSLALAPAPGFRRRDSLIGLFWPELEECHARAALRQAVHVIRRALGECVIASRGAEEIGLDRTSTWCDGAAFQAHVAAGRLEEACSLYRGPLLDGFFLPGAPQFEDWLEDARGQLATMAASAAWSLSARAERSGDAAAAVRLARRAFALTPDDETALRALLGTLERCGDSCGAVREYERFARRLWREYQIVPAAETQAIIRRLRGPLSALRDEAPGDTAIARTRVGKA